MKKLKDLAVVTGTYQKDGKTKKRYQNIGALMESENGQFLLLDPLINLAAVPREEGRDRVVASMFEPKDKAVLGDEQYKAQTGAHNAAKANGYVNDPAMQGPLDDIPFN